MIVDYIGCDAEIIKDHNALTYTLKPRDLEEAADVACKLKVSDMNTVFPDVSINLLSHQDCFAVSSEAVLGSPIHGSSPEQPHRKHIVTKALCL